MPDYAYRALQPTGAVAEGTIEAGGRQEAYRLLDERGLRTLQLRDAASSREKPRRATPTQGRSRVSGRALEAFTRQLSSLLAAGVPLARALRLLFRETADAGASEQWKAVHDLVIDGSSLAGAMSQSPRTFPKVYVAMVQAGETGGFLDLVLDQIAEFQNREKELRAKVAAALIYPAVLAFLSVAVIIFLMVFFIPRFQDIFADFGAALPVLTRWIVSASRGVKAYGPFAVLGIVALSFACQRWLRTETGRRRWEHVLLRLPLLGALTARFAMTRFCRMLGTLTGAGVPLISALRVARESLGNQTLTDAVSTSIERVQQGDRLGASLANCPVLFPASVLEMISVAEQSGRLDAELVRLATVTEGDLDRQLRSAVALAEPAMLFVMAAFIGVIVVGMVLPIFTIQELIK